MEPLTQPSKSRLPSLLKKSCLPWNQQADEAAERAPLRGSGPNSNDAYNDPEDSQNSDPFVEVVEDIEGYPHQHQHRQPKEVGC